MATVKENLIAALALIDTPEKWGKGNYETKDGCLCALGAVVRTHNPFFDFRSDLIRSYPEDRALAKALPGRWSVVHTYNDHPRTTHTDTMDLYDRAIEAAE